jgi:hypothetical protein
MAVTTLDGLCSYSIIFSLWYVIVLYNFQFFCGGYSFRFHFQESSKPPLATTIFFGANDAALSGRTSERQHVPIPEYKLNLQKIVLHLKVLLFCI